MSTEYIFQRILRKMFEQFHSIEDIFNTWAVKSVFNGV